MKIIRLNSYLLKTPLKQPIRTAIHRFDQVYHVVLEVTTDEGIKGQGFLFAQSETQGQLFQSAIAHFEDKVLGENPLMVEAIWQKLWKAMNFIGNSGVAIFALSAIDTALWDIVGKVANLPLYQILGGKSESVPVYASGGLWLGSDTATIVKEAENYVAEGYTALKIRVGLPDLADDVARVRAVRAAIGSKIKLMADANQGWNAPTAIKFGRAVAEDDLYWLEEPVPYYDFAASRAIAESLDTILATGETEYTYLGFQRLHEEKAADLWMPDLQRVGGISGWRKIATLGEVYNVPVSPHLFPEESVHLALSAPTCSILEYVDWWQPLLEDQTDKPRLLDGRLVPGTKPGLGFEISQATLKLYQS